MWSREDSCFLGEPIVGIPNCLALLCTATAQCAAPPQPDCGLSGFLGASTVAKDNCLLSEPI